LATTKERSDGREGGVKPPSQPATKNAIFAVRGEYWTLGYGGTTFPLKDVKGLIYIQRLLQHPGQEFHSLDLLRGPGTINLGENEHRTSLQIEGTDSVGGLGDSGEMLDAQAKQEYKRKLRELNEQLEDQRERGDHARAEQVAAEIDFLNREIARAVGLGGRDRRAGSASERARINITRAIKAALQKISERHPSMGEMLDRSIRTGSFCSYASDHQDQVTWQFSEGRPEASGEAAVAVRLSSPRESGFLRTIREGTTFVGRDAEHSTISRCLQRALDGEGRIVLIGGAPGVGKTRIAAEIGAKAAQLGADVFVGSCYDRDGAVPFSPFVEILESVLAQASSPAAFRQTLGTNAAEIARLMPQLRTIFPDIPERLDISPEQSRRMLLNAFVELLVRLAQNRPVLLLLDDLHWGDEGTWSLLSHIARSVSSIPVLIVGTFRDDELDSSVSLAKTLDELTRRHLLERVNLIGLSESAVCEMIRSLSGQEPPTLLVAAIYSATEGNPFFVEELCKHLKEQGRLSDSGGKFLRSFKLDDLDVPQSLRLVIGRNLARLADQTRKILGAAAIIGRAFTFSLLEASTRVDTETLLDCVEEAEKAGVIASTLEYPETLFRFSHELIRQTVLSEISPPRRQRLHQQIAQVLEQQFPSIADNQPESLAHHCTEAGLAERAVFYWLRAGHRAAEGSANVEAAAHLTRGLKLLPTIPAGLERDRLELSMQTLLAGILRSIRGIAAQETGQAYVRSRELCHRLQETTQLLPVLNGLYAYHLNRAQFVPARDAIEELQNLPQTKSDPTFQMIACRGLGAIMLHTGELEAARDLLQKSLGLYDRSVHRDHAVLFGIDPKEKASSYLSMALWMLGYPDRALAAQRAALEHAEQLEHAHSLAQSLTYLCLLHTLRQEPTAVVVHARRLLNLSEEYSFPLLAAVARIVIGWATSRAGDIDTGLEEMRRGLESCLETGTQNNRSHFHALLAASCGKRGLYEEGLKLVDEAQAWVSTSGERWFDAELYRVQGELLAGSGGNNQSRAENCFQEAIRIARSQKAKMWELRATVSLIQLQRKLGHLETGLELLAPLYESFEEGFDTPDLRSARDLLEK
jgi:predicted ATPase